MSLSPRSAVKGRVRTLIRHRSDNVKFKHLPLIMVFRRKILCGGRSESYFHDEILILVCPNRTCKIFENRPANKVLMAEMNFE